MDCIHMLLHKVFDWNKMNFVHLNDSILEKLPISIPSEIEVGENTETYSEFDNKKIN